MNKKQYLKEGEKENDASITVGWEPITEEIQFSLALSDLVIVRYDRERLSQGKKNQIAYLCDALEKLDPAFGDTEGEGP